MASDPNHYNAMLDANADARLTSARVVLEPLIRMFGPRSVLDIGCGHGAWLLAARELGVEEIYGIDGPWIEPDSLVIPNAFFSAQPLDQTLDLGKQFDLVLSLEVAEHLPAKASDLFVDSLTRHGDIVVFSAAIPYQGGNGHVNEQWPGYWADKFAARGYTAVDVIRPDIWTNDNVFWWLRQNIVLYMGATALAEHPQLQPHVVTDTASLARVHPELYLRWVKHGLATG